MDEFSTNDRASRGNTALSAWVNEAGDQGDDETNLRDLLADLMHFADAMGIDFHDQVRIAGDNYAGEIFELGKATGLAGSEEDDSANV